MENLLTQNNESNFWQPDVQKAKHLRKISPTQLRALGLSVDSAKYVDTIDELRNDPPNIIIAEAAKNFSFVQNWFKKQSLKKKQKYVMGLGVYQQMFKGTEPNVNLGKVLKPANTKFRNNYRPYMGENLTDKTLLVFRTGGIGDLLFIQPNLRFLKEKYPTCTINFACGPQYQPMVENWDCIDNMLDLPFSFKWLNEAHYHALFEGVIERCKQAHIDNAYNLFSRWLGLDLPDHLLVPQQDPKPDKLDECVEILNRWGVEKFVLTQLKASSPIRTPRPQFWVNLINKLTDEGNSVLITDNPRQAEIVDRFIKMTKNQDMVFNFCKHSKSLDYTIALTKLANCVVATDSAMNHIAASMNTPCYGIYGPFPGFIRLKTYPKARWVDGRRHCSPCFIHGHTPCPEAGKDGFSPCYDNIDLDKVASEIGEMING